MLCDLGPHRNGTWSVPDDLMRNITVVLSFGMVDTSFDMAVCFAVMATTMLTSEFLLVVVSMKKATLPGPDAPDLVRIQEVAVERMETAVENRCIWPLGGQDLLHSTFCTACDRREEGARTVAFTDVDQMARAAAQRSQGVMQPYDVWGVELSVDVFVRPFRCVLVAGDQIHST